MDAPYLYHYRDRWPSPHRIDWGGPGIIRSVELQRSRVIVILDEKVASHPEGVTTFDIAFDLPGERFAELQTAMSRCFHGFDWYVDQAS